jgi:small-conductance mechanosensitive channel
MNRPAIATRARLRTNGGGAVGPFALFPFAPLALVRLAVLLLAAAAILLASPGRARAGQEPPVWPASTEAGAADTLDRETPRRTLAGFLKEGREGDFRAAAGYLDLRAVSPTSRDHDGPELAQKLAFILERRRSLSLIKVPDTPEGDPTAKTPALLVVDTLYASEDAVPISLERVRFADGIERWLIARSTVMAIPALDAVYGPRPVGIPIPSSLTRVTFLGNEPWQWIGVAIMGFAAYALARALAWLFVRVGRYFAQRTRTRADDALVESARRPLRMVLGALLYRLLLEPLQLTAAVVEISEHVTYTFLVIGVAWLVLRALGVATAWLDEHAGAGTDAFRGRRVRTQAMVLRRVASIGVAVVAGSFVLLQFEFVRSVGVSLLASAGVVSVVVGFAAQRSLSAIVGGVQFSFAQPVRVGDQIVAEGEFGEVEEIYLTYAVVRLWDKRRLVVPITYFLEKPFQNWTRSGTDLLGVVMIRVDYGMPLEPARAELERVCAADPRWDKTVCKLQMVDVDATTATLRALVSAADAGALWDLRCSVRERLVDFVCKFEGGRYLPRARGENVVVSPAPSPSGGPPLTPAS